MASCNIKDKITNVLKEKGFINTHVHNKITINYDQLYMLNEFRDILSEAYKKFHNIKSDEKLFDRIQSEQDIILVFNEELIDEIEKKESDKSFNYSLFVSQELQSRSDIERKTRVDVLLGQKNRLLKAYKNKLKDINAIISNPQNNLSKEELENLIELKNKINKAQNSLYRTIADINSNKEEYELFMNSEEDLDVAEALINNNNPLVRDLINNIIEFYQSIDLSKQNLDNPIFTNEIYDDRGNILLPATLRAKIENIVNRANELDRKRVAQNKEVVNNLLLETGAIRLYEEHTGKKITIDEMLRIGARDVSFLEKHMFDVTTTLTTNSLAELLPKLAQHVYHNEFTRQEHYKISLQTRLIKNKPKLLERMKQLGFVKKFGKWTSVDYDLFFEKDEYGNITDKIISLFSPAYRRLKENIDSDFERTKDAYLQNKISKSKYTSSIRKRLNWYKNNTETINIFRLIDLKLNKQHYDEHFIEYTGEEKQAYKEYLINKIGIDAYDSIIKETQSKINEYEITIESITSQEKLETFKKYNNPGIYIKNRNKVNSLNFLTFLPKNEIIAGTEFGQNKFVSGYSENYKLLLEEGNESLLEFYKIYSELNDYINAIPDPTLKKHLSDHSVLRIEKLTFEILSDPSIPFLTKLSTIIKKWVEDLKEKIGTKPRENISGIRFNHITGKPLYGVDTSWITTNKTKVQKQIDIELINLLKVYNQEVSEADQVTDLYPGKLNISSNLRTQAYLAHMIGVNDLNEIGWIDINNVDIRSVIEQCLINQSFQEQSKDLHLILNQQIALVTLYHARNTVLTDMIAIRSLYVDISKITNKSSGVINYDDKNTTDDILYHELDGLKTNQERQNAITRFDSWFYNNILGIHYTDEAVYIKDTDRTIGDDIKAILNKINPHRNSDEINLNALSEEDAKRVIFSITGRTNKLSYVLKRDKEIAKKLEDGIIYLEQKITDTEQSLNEYEKESDQYKDVAQKISDYKFIRNRLVNNYENILNTITWKSLMDCLLEYIRFIGLGYSFRSAVNNFFEGQISNSIQAASGRFVSQKSYYKARRILNTALLKTISFGKIVTPNNSKTRVLMERYNILQDSSDEFRKSLNKSTYGKLSDITNPYALTSRVEYLNQSPLLIAMLMDTEIKGVDEITTSSVWDAMDENGKLKPDFRTKENIETWENCNSEEYVKFKSKIDEAIVSTHGDYSETRGNMSNYNTFSKVMFIFKRWFPRHLANRFQTEQLSLELGKWVKGRQRSHNTGTVAVSLFTAAFMIFNLPITLAATGIGTLAFNLSGLNTGVTKTGNIILDMLAFIKDVSVQYLNLPVRLLTRHAGIGSISQGKLRNIDYENYKANAQEVAILLMLTTLMMAIKSAFADDDDDDEDESKTKSTIKNISSNIIMQQINQMVSYANPVGTAVDFVEGNSLLRTTDNWYKFFKSLSDENKYFVTGAKKGESKSWHYFKKVTLPSILRDEYLGLGVYAEKEFDPWVHNDLFLTEEQKSKKKLGKSKTKIIDKISNNKDLSDNEKNKLLKDVDKIFKKKKGDSYKSTKERIDKVIDEDNVIDSIKKESNKKKKINKNKNNKKKNTSKKKVE